MTLYALGKNRTYRTLRWSLDLVSMVRSTVCTDGVCNTHELYN